MANKLPDKGAVAGNVFPATAPLSSSRESGQNGRQEVDLFVLLPVLGGQDTSLALADEGDEFHNFGQMAVFGFQLIQSVGPGQARMPHLSEGLLESRHQFLRGLGPAQPHDIGRLHQGAVAHGQHPGRQILGDARHAAHKGVFAHAGELVHGGQAADDGPVVHKAMSGQGGVVGHHHSVAHHAVVGNVDVGHKQIVVADAGYAAAPFGAAVQGGKLADIVAVAHHEAGDLAVKLEVLGFAAHQGVGMDMVVPAQGGVAFDAGEGVDAGALAHDHVGLNLGAGTDDHAVAQFRAGVHKGRRVDDRRHQKPSLSMAEAVSEASAANLPST